MCPPVPPPATTIGPLTGAGKTPRCGEGALLEVDRALGPKDGSWVRILTVAAASSTWCSSSWLAFQMVRKLVEGRMMTAAVLGCVVDQGW